MRTNAEGLRYEDGNKFYWDININPNATIGNALPNCTTFVFGAVQEAGLPKPVSVIRGAGRWHEFLTNGWEYEEYRKDRLKVGDIVEWSDHVAVVSTVENGEVYISGSFYTGMHGKAHYGGGYDTRPYGSLQELSNAMQEYQYRLFHLCTVEKESNSVGSQPLYRLIAPKTIDNKDRDFTKNQIYVKTNEQNLRKGHSTKDEIIGTSRIGYYNSLETFDGNDYVWHRVDKITWIAQVKNRVEYLPKTKDVNYEELYLQAKAKLDKINEILKL